jgi:hypothetical protein
MNQRTTQVLFALLRSATSGEKLTDKERGCYSPELLSDLMKISSEHDVAHLLVLGLKRNELLSKEDIGLEKDILRAVYRYEQLNYEYENLCDSLEKAQVPFLPLKGAVVRKYYPEPWMRTSCDIDVLVQRENLAKAISHLTEDLQYVRRGRTAHDVSLHSPTGVHIELHFDLVEEGRANNAIDVLRSVWKNVTLCEKSKHQYEMSDAFFYFYHIAHMAKHFEVGGCGVRPFIDLWILDHIEGVDKSKRDELLSSGGLLKFADVSRTLSEVWFSGREPDALTLQVQDFLLHGGAFGSAENRVALHQKARGGRIGYIMSRVFVPYARLKRYYPIVEERPWLTPFVQVRRWFMLLKPDVASMAKRELAANAKITKSTADEMSAFLDNVGL